MKRLIGMLTVAGIVAVSGFCSVALADDGAGAAPKHKDGVKHERPEATDMTVTGVIAKESKTLKDGKTVDVFTLTDGNGSKVWLGGERKDAGEVAAKLADYVGKSVTITGKGFKREHDGKTMTRITEIIKVEAAAAAAAPVAPVVPAK